VFRRLRYVTVIYSFSFLFRVGSRAKNSKHACRRLMEQLSDAKYKRWRELSEEERLECLKRYIVFAQARTKVQARWLLISHLQWNKWWALFDAPPIPKRSITRFYSWLTGICEKAGLREGLDYRLLARQRHRQKRVKGVLVNNQALATLVSISL